MEGKVEEEKETTDSVRSALNWLLGGRIKNIAWRLTRQALIFELGRGAKHDRYTMVMKHLDSFKG